LLLLQKSSIEGSRFFNLFSNGAAQTAHVTFRLHVNLQGGDGMIRVQILERPGADLFSALKAAMRGGDLRTFSLEKRGWKVVHERYPGWMNWSHGQGAITCEILSPQKPAGEWQFLGALVGRLADKYARQVESINIQLPPPTSHIGRKRKK
jgi:hypothetical protein